MQGHLRATPARTGERTSALAAPLLWHFRRDGRPLVVAVSGTVSADEATVLMQATLAGAGVSMLPLHLVGPAIARGELVALLPDHALEEMSVLHQDRSRSLKGRSSGSGGRYRRNGSPCPPDTRRSSHHSPRRRRGQCRRRTAARRSR